MRKQKKTIDLLCEVCEIVTKHKIGDYLIMGKVERKKEEYKEFKDYRLYTCDICKNNVFYDHNFIALGKNKLNKRNLRTAYNEKVSD